MRALYSTADTSVTESALFQQDGCMPCSPFAFVHIRKYFICRIVDIRLLHGVFPAQAQPLYLLSVFHTACCSLNISFSGIEIEEQIKAPNVKYSQEALTERTAELLHLYSI